MKNQAKGISTFCVAITLFSCLSFGILLSGCSGGSGNDENTDAAIWYQDSDGDGYGNPGVSVKNASQPSGYVYDNTDCDDSEPAVHPGAIETCGDGIDQDCGGSDLSCEIEETTWYLDSDGDGYGNPFVFVENASQPSGYVSDNTDCDDSEPTVNPGAIETCGDGIDQNCNGSDPACEIEESTWYKDIDGDGYSDGITQMASSQPSGYFLLPDLTAGSGDCDDNNPSVNPDATEDCADGQDNDCNGVTDCEDGNCASAANCDDGETGELTYPVVDTMQISCYDLSGNVIVCGSAYSGQDAQYSGNQASYTNNGDGTITDNITGLMWTQAYMKADFYDAQSAAESASAGGYDDWRVPTTKELYSLIYFSGAQGTADPNDAEPPDDAIPFIDTGYFDFEYGTEGTRYIDAQYVAATEYVATVMNGQKAFFGVNFADGRIKGYPQSSNTGEDRYFLRLVRGSGEYGQNKFTDNGDGTISDRATGLMWMQVDSGDDQFADSLSGFTYDDGSMNWGEALEFAENVNFAGYGDWRLPNAKELHTIVDYTRAPDVTDSAAIDPFFDATQIINEAAEKDYPFYWTSTSFTSTGDAVIIQFGRSLGYMNGQFMDVHGAGGQRTDPKTGVPSYGNGPQGDVRRVYNYVRLVREEISK